jgi:hypothetical protein
MPRALAAAALLLALGCTPETRAIACSPAGTSAVDRACELLLEESVDRCAEGELELETCTEWLIASAVCLESFREQDRRCR